MSLRLMKNITSQSWDIISMHDAVIDWFNKFVKYQQDLLVFTDHKGRLIVDGDAELTWVDGNKDENEAPIKV